MAFNEPLTALSLIAAPAVLTNASAVLAAGTLTRFGRAIDRARQLAAILDKPGMLETVEGQMRYRQFERTQKRTLLLLRALSQFYLSLGCFAASSLLALLGGVFSSLSPAFGQQIGPVFAAAIGAVGVTTLALGCAALVRETRLAVVTISEERDIIRRMLPGLDSSEPE